MVQRTKPRIDMSGVTPFRRRVFTALLGVPLGRVTTYKRLAQRIGCGSPRAVGQALRSNPFAPSVPCHRVIAEDMSPGGFQGKRSGRALASKLCLLREEGVTFRNGRLSDPDRIHTFATGR